MKNLKERFTRWYVRRGYTATVGKDFKIAYNCPLPVRFFARYMLSMVQYPWERMKKVFCDVGKASTKATGSLKKFSDSIAFAESDFSGEITGVAYDDVMSYEKTEGSSTTDATQSEKQ